MSTKNDDRIAGNCPSAAADCSKDDRGLIASVSIMIGLIGGLLLAVWLGSFTDEQKTLMFLRSKNESLQLELETYRRAMILARQRIDSELAEKPNP